MAYWVIFGLLPCLEPIGKALKGSILKEMKQLALVLVTATCMWGCSTDLEINAPYKDATVVYGLLNMRDSIHFVKINKAFLGEGDALNFAQIQDSNEWAPDRITTAKVYRVLNGTRIGEFDLRDTVLTDREPGVFYSPVQRIYYFQDDFRANILQNGQPTTVYLDQNSEYELELEINGERITAIASMVNDFSFQSTDQSLTAPVNLMNGSGDEYGEFELNWSSNRDGKRYVAEYRFNYKELRGTDTSEMRSITQRIGTAVSTDGTSVEEMSVIMRGEQFYTNLADQIPSDASVDHRIFTGLDLIISVANNEFHTFLTLTEPVSGIIEDRPTFSNVANGYGLFAGRYVKQINGKRLGAQSLRELADGNITGSLSFCSNFAADENSPYTCPD